MHMHPYLQIFAGIALVALPFLGFPALSETAFEMAVGATIAWFGIAAWWQARKERAGADTFVENTTTVISHSPAIVMDDVKRRDPLPGASARMPQAQAPIPSPVDFIASPVKRASPQKLSAPPKMTADIQKPDTENSPHSISVDTSIKARTPSVAKGVAPRVRAPRRKPSPRRRMTSSARTPEPVATAGFAAGNWE